MCEDEKDEDDVSNFLVFMTSATHFHATLKLRILLIVSIMYNIVYHIFNCIPQPMERNQDGSRLSVAVRWTQARRSCVVYDTMIFGAMEEDNDSRSRFGGPKSFPGQSM